MKKAATIMRYTQEALEADAELGPAMKALNPRQRGFVMAKFDLGDHPSDTECAYAAGYTGTEKSMPVQAHRLAHSEKILTAIREEADRRAAGLLPIAHRRMMEKLLDPGDKDNWAVTKHVQALQGQSPKQIHEVHHVTDRKALIAEIESSLKLLQGLGVSISNDLVPRKAITAEDTEFEIVSTKEGLEDLL